jgi:translation initiation factor 1
MPKNKSNSFSSLGGLVYSTDPNFKTGEPEPVTETLPAAEQPLRVWLETKHRGGKAVSIIAGFRGADEDLQALGKQVKTVCGTGGSAKDGEIIIQGDNRDKILQWLLKNGYKLSKKAGG